MKFAAREYSVPLDLQNKITSILLQRYSVSLADAKKIAKCIEQLSDFYIRLPGNPTPWHEEWCQIAYLAYYLPLNEIRNRAVIEEGQRLGFFAGLKSVQDFGSGLGSGTSSLKELTNQTHIESSKKAQELHRLLGGQGQWQSSPSVPSTKSLLVMSYSLTELEDLPPWAQNFEALMILEPSTQQQARKLQHIRQQLIQSGFHIWAPCTHQGSCPLLTQSKSDWCHDRVHFAQPEWFQEIEKLLPMKNRTLTFSYLLARRGLQPDFQNQAIARITGDTLHENGKTRQLVCRNENREYLAWLHKLIDAQEIPRGELIIWPEKFTLKSNEIRVQEAVQLHNAQIYPARED